LARCFTDRGYQHNRQASGAVCSKQPRTIENQRCNKLLSQAPVGGLSTLVWRE